ncbi:hypothetical protein VIGAN_09037300 [Vigna angularis var. angularis]|uniref:Uncharacterized protein n=1 Tax=Vigna angularis var. angularis TaxID=157739 RepID=A0A0S3SVZ7_PHAAN|nr:hypothetical protein VIGAN_09037300 [Vigna angularis var. angularis]
MIQQMVLSTLSTLGIQSKSSSVSQPWFLYFGTSNYMSDSSENLHNLHQKIQIVDDNTLFITSIYDLNPDFRNVLVSPGLASNLLSFGQLMDNNCDVKFSRFGCLMQERVSEKVIMKGSKVLFPLKFIYNNLSFVCNNVINLYEVWHRNLVVIQILLFCLTYLKLVCWEVKMFFLVHLLLVLFANWLKVQCFLFQLVLSVFRLALK